MNIKKTKFILLIAFIFATIGLIYFIGVTYIELKSAFKESDEIKTSIKKLALLEKIQSDIQNVETYQYSFIINNNEKHCFSRKNCCF